MFVECETMSSKYDYGFELIHEIVKSKWVPEILAAINKGYENYNEILEAISFLSSTELNRKLNLLVEKQAVEKTVYPENRTSYRLLPLGKDLDHIFKHFIALEEKYFSGTT